MPSFVGMQMLVHVSVRLFSLRVNIGVQVRRTAIPRASVADLRVIGLIPLTNESYIDS